MQSTQPLKKLSQSLPHQPSRMPLLFIGHGSPMNALEENAFAKKWQTLGQELPKPSAILCISAYLETPGTFITAMEKGEKANFFNDELLMGAISMTSIKITST